jgi:hypothetical protein
LYVAAVGWRLFTFGLAALVVASGALAQGEEDRVRLTPPGFSTATVVAVPVLSEFRRIGFDGDSGGWEGPLCDHPTFPGPIALTWSVRIEQSSTSADEAAEAALTFQWRVVGRGPVSVRHVVAGRNAGVLPGALLVTDSQSPQGWHEAGLGVALGDGFYVGAAAWSRGNTFACTVRSAQGPVASHEWHRVRSTQALEGVRVDGSLRPGRTTARGFATRVSGAVRDVFGHPVAGARVALERRAGRRWRRVGVGSTGVTGAYAVRARKRGRYRAVATLAGSSARSGVVRAGR